MSRWEEDDTPLRVELVDSMDHLDAQVYATRGWCEAAVRALTAYDACLMHAEQILYPNEHRSHK